VKLEAPNLGRDWGRIGALETWPELSHKLPEREHEFGRGFIQGVKLGKEITPDRWGKLRRRRFELGRWCAEIFERFDLLLTPTLPFDPPPAKGPFPAETEGREQPAASVASFTIPFNLSWHPAATVRAGMSKAGLPVGLCVASLEACHFEPGTVYAAINGKRHDDFECYLYRSTDYGANWERITANIPGSIANVIKQDPTNQNLLFAGTDRGVYVSTNGAESWDVLGKDLPTVYVHDLALQTTEDFAVVSTHGRGCFVLDIRNLRSSKTTGVTSGESPESNESDSTKSDASESDSSKSN
jgi:hypothetical protein